VTVRLAEVEASLVPIISGTYCVNTDATRAVGMGFHGQRLAEISVDRLQIYPSTGTFLTGRLTVWGIAHA